VPYPSNFLMFLRSFSVECEIIGVVLMRTAVWPSDKHQLLTEVNSDLRHHCNSPLVRYWTAKIASKPRICLCCCSNGFNTDLSDGRGDSGPLVAAAGLIFCLPGLRQVWREELYFYVGWTF
jgi:hypothetical protein